MATLIIRRKNQWFNNLFDFKILLNSSKVLDVANGQTKAFKIENGSYVLQAKCWFMKSQPLKLHLAKNEARQFVVSGYGNGYWKTFLNIEETA